MKLWCLACAAVLAVFLAGNWNPRHLFPKKIIDSLNAPLRVTAVNEKGLTTSDGRTLLPPLFSEIQSYPWLSQDILAHGVELASDGTMHVLVHVHHWCGNDPVRFHLARVDLSSLLLFAERERRIQVSQHGIDPTTFMMVQVPHREMKEFYDQRDRSTNKSSSANPFD